MREASVVAVLTAVLAGCGGRSELSMHAGADGAVSSGGAPALAGGGAVPDQGASRCVPRDLGSALGIPVVEGVLAGSSAYSSACGGTGPEQWFLWTAPMEGHWAFDALGSDGDVSVTVLVGSRGCTGFGTLGCGTGGKAAVIYLPKGDTVTLLVDTNAPTSGYLLNISGPVDEDKTTDLYIGGMLGTPVRVGRLGQDSSLTTTFGCGGGESPAVVTSWTAPSYGFFNFDTTGSSFDTLLEFRRGDSVYACSDDYQGTDAHLDMYFKQGDSVSIFLGGKAVFHPEEARYVLSITKQ